MNESLREGRLEEIIESLRDNAPFFCHKTIDYEGESKMEMIEKSSYCAGSLIYLMKAGAFNLPMHMGVKFGLFDPETLEGHEFVIEPLGGRE
jgi:hypothetical protein